MDAPFDIQQYMSKGVEDVVSSALRATLTNPRESAFMAKFALASTAANRKRQAAEAKGEHIPPFLIASITSKCNLHCTGCYSRCTHATTDAEPQAQLTEEEWFTLFSEAAGLGISFILLAGGEPLLRRDVIERAGKLPNILFPIFTNGVFIDERYFALFDKCRNLVPIMSIEGDREQTDSRRGSGIYDRLIATMDEFKNRGLVFGASVTVTTQNYREVVSDAFLARLSERGCKAVIFVEYVPVSDESEQLAPTDSARDYLAAEIRRLRTEKDGMVYISFPGDEKTSDGCLAAGRGFFHINSHGGAEPCPFSPYSDINVKALGLKGALRSPLFTALRDVLKEAHSGGCILFEKWELVERLIAQEADKAEKKRA